MLTKKWQYALSSRLIEPPANSVSLHFTGMRSVLLLTTACSMLIPCLTNPTLGAMSKAQFFTGMNAINFIIRFDSLCERTGVTPEQIDLHLHNLQ